MTDFPALCRRLLELSEQATQPPWYATGIAFGVRHLERNVDAYFDGCPEDHNLPGRNGGDAGMNDGSLIAESRNAIEPLCRELLRVMEFIETLRERCPHRGIAKSHCIDCGMHEDEIRRLEDEARNVEAP